ncbi:MAG TPA: hypothetical protein ENJ20_05875 [Bacteroidetes bacterium]|nr:hypothetical protein [Bacteroidota bacterium]
MTAQKGEAIYNGPDERLLIESRWRYTYTLHAGSNTIIHRAENRYDYYLYFRYDYTYMEFLNDRLRFGEWRLDGRTLHYRFKNIPEFKIPELNKSILILEFTRPNSKGTYQYHFVRVDSKEAPFPKPDNELPEVLVEADDPNAPIADKRKKRRRGWLSRLFQRNKIREVYLPEENLTYISIELIGGGYYGGINPVLKDFIMIKTDGRLIKEIQTVQEGLMVTKKYIPRSELEKFAEYVSEQGFFEMERIYDCTDPACMKRKKQKPTPVPLRLSVAYGKRKKVVTIAIWGKDNANIKYVDYPPALDNIIDAIQKMANRMEDPMVRK